MSGRGVDAFPIRIPERWDEARAWLERFIREQLSLADVRNAVQGPGIAISSAPDTAATISASSDIDALLQASLVTVTAASGLPNSRQAIAGAGIEITDEGAGPGTVTIEVDNIPLSAFPAIQPLSVLGFPYDSVNVEKPLPIAAGANDRVFARTSDTLGFVQLTVDMAPDGLWTYAKLQDISTDARVLGRATGAPDAIEELTLSEVLDFVGSAADGDILIRSGGGWTRLAAGTDGDVLMMVSGEPAWVTPGWAPDDATYVTIDSETTDLAASRQLVAGDGISLDTSTPGEIEVVNDNP